MEGCLSHLSFDIGVSHSIITIICLMYSLIFGGGVPVVLSSWWPNNRSWAVARQSLCLLSWNAHINSLKASTHVWTLLIQLQNAGIMFSSIWPGIPKINSRTLTTMMLWASVVLWFLFFSIQTVKYEFDFNFFPGVIVNGVVPPSGDNIFVSVLMFLTCEVNSMVLMPIVFVKQCKTPVRTNFFSSIPISNNLPNLFKDLLCGHKESLKQTPSHTYNAL